jgi:hypothetical protein
MQQNLILTTTSPLAKIFMRRFRVDVGEGKIETVYPEDLLADKERIWKREKFCVPFPTVQGNIEFWSGVPAPITDATQRAVLVGGRSGFDGGETDWTGLVMLDVDVNVLSGIFAVMGGGKAPNVEKAVKEAMKVAEVKSHERCMKAARNVFHRMQLQRKAIQEEGKGHYSPSPTEQLCAIVLEREATAEVTRQRRQDEEFQAILDRIDGSGAGNAANAAI